MLPIFKFRYLENIKYSSMAILSSCFLSMMDWFGEIKQIHEPWNYGARDAHAFYVVFFAVFFAVFKNLKSSFSQDIMPVYALDVLNTKNEDQTSK